VRRDHDAGASSSALRLRAVSKEAKPAPSREVRGGRTFAPSQTLQIPDRCGCSTEYLPVPAGDGWWSLVPIWEPAQTPTPLPLWEPAVSYWATDT
jgi:hypothetical protein